MSEQVAVTRKLSDVTARPIDWLWAGRIPYRKITLIDGSPGLGKSIATLDLAARVSRGAPMPDGSLGDLPGAANVLLLFTEDDAEDTVRPRLEAASADLDRIYEVRGVGSPNREGIRPITLEDVAALRELIDQKSARLVIVDPFSTHVGNHNTNAEGDMRAVLSPLAELARESKSDVAIVIVRHLRKSGGPSVDAGAGSIAIAGAARSVLLVARDPEDPDGRVLAHSKGNLGPLASSLKYRVDTKPLTIGERAQATPYVVWGSTSDASADALLAAASESVADQGAQTDAKDWLLDTLASREVAASELDKMAERAGHKKRTLERARTALRKAGRIECEQRGKGAAREWHWSLSAKGGDTCGVAERRSGEVASTPVRQPSPPMA